jgi:hypothetical protein
MKVEQMTHQGRGADSFLPRVLRAIRISKLTELLSDLAFIFGMLAEMIHDPCQSQGGSLCAGK